MYGSYFYSQSWFEATTSLSAVARGAQVSRLSSSTPTQALGSVLRIGHHARLDADRRRQDSSPERQARGDHRPQTTRHEGGSRRARPRRARNRSPSRPLAGRLFRYLRVRPLAPRDRDPRHRRNRLETRAGIRRHLPRPISQAVAGGVSGIVEWTTCMSTDTIKNVRAARVPAGNLRSQARSSRAA